MRRSEVVNLIAETLVEPRYDDILEEASFILKRLENAGMLPPEHGLDYEGKALNEWEDEE